MNSTNAITLGSVGSKPRCIMIGGFLGAGKTTAIGKLAAWFQASGLRVGVITNDQGSNLVDTTLLRAQGLATGEIPGGCFCCRFNALIDAVEKLRLETQPDVVIAEPVGSCTDLAATVTYPLRKLHGAQFTVAPVSVVVDPMRAEGVLGLGGSGGFSEKVKYIYRKQLQEADLIVIAKTDLSSASRVDALRQAIAAQFPRKDILAVSSRAGTNLEAWFSRLATETQTATTAMKLDYNIYAEGEALLGWLNCTVNLSAKKAVTSNIFLVRLANEVQKRLRAGNVEIAHLKMALKRSSGVGKVAAANLVRSEAVPELTVQSQELLTHARLTINLRAETAPDNLGAAVREGLAATAAAFPGLSPTIDHFEQFRPGKPTPTHRLEACQPDGQAIHIDA